MSDLKDVAFLDATAQAELVRNGEVSPHEMVEAAIERIEKLNPQLNAVIKPMYDLARENAKAPLGDGPFAGVPFLLKDIGAMHKDVETCLGTRVLKGMFFPDHDSELTIRFKKAGLNILGKTNTPEFGILPTTEPLAYGPSRNPWNPDRTTGGSSGGAAAAVASGMVPVAHANDGGGSIRIPASCCGLFGLKPTRARNPLGPDFGDMLSGLICEHVVSRSVRDSAAILDATAGPDLGDPYWAPPQERPYTQEVGAKTGKLRIALCMQSMILGDPHPDCMEAVQETAKLCEELGHHVEEAVPQVNGQPGDMERAFNVLWTSGIASNVGMIATLGGITPNDEIFEPLTFNLYERGKEHSAADYLQAVTTLQRLSRDVAAFFKDYDLLLTPVLGKPPIAIGDLDAPADKDFASVWMKVVEFAPYTAIFNATGQPAMSVPLHWNGDNLPIGSHFVGRFGDEATLFRLAAQLEEARPWAHRRPPICA